MKNYQKLLEVQATIEETSKLTEDKDTEIRELAASELKDLKEDGPIYHFKGKKTRKNIDKFIRINMAKN